MAFLREVLDAIPDTPRHVAARGMLISQVGCLAGRARLSPLACVIVSRADRLAQVVGRPEHGVLRAAVRGVDSVLVAPEHRAWVVGALPGWADEPATLYGSNTGTPATDASACRMLAEGDVASIEVASTALATEIRGVLGRGLPVGGAFDGSRVVATCYAAYLTESYWDVSVDTLPAWRRRGFATRVASFMMAHYSGEGRRPVWGAAASNAPSGRLALRLGLAPLDELVVLSRESSTRGWARDEATPVSHQPGL